MKKVPKKLVIITSVLAAIIVFCVEVFVYFVYGQLTYYNVPIATYQMGNITSDFRTDSPEGFETRQFGNCLPKRWCTFEHIFDDNLIIFRNENKYSDKQFGNVVEIKAATYMIEQADENGEKISREIPKEWVFGRD